MKKIEQITDELIDDAMDTCMNDSGYLRSILRSYFSAAGEEERRRWHADAFGPDVLKFTET